MRRFAFYLFGILLTFLATTPALASTELRTKFVELAKQVLAETKGQSVTVGVFSQTGLPETNSGPGLEGVLTDALNRHTPGIVKAEARYEVKGDYSYAKSRNVKDNLKVIKVTVRIIEKEFSEELLKIPLQIALDHTQTVAELLQITASIPPDGSKEERNQKLEESRKSPGVHIHGPHKSLVSTTSASPFAVEVLVKPLNAAEQPGQPRQARVEDGLAFVDIQPGELYELKVFNFSPAEVAVSASIDGLDVFHFADAQHRQPDGKPKFSHFIVAPSVTTPIVGWFQKLAPPNNYLSFLVTGYGQGAVSKAGLTARGQVGVIHLQFSKCFPLVEGQVPRSASNETGFGPPKSVEQKAVRYEIEPPHEFITIRYTRPH